MTFQKYKPMALVENVAAVTGDPVAWPGGEGIISAEGAFSGGAVALQMQTANNTWVPVHNPGFAGNVSFSAAGTTQFFLPPCQIRVVTTLGTGFYAYAYPVASVIITGN